jgi:FAD/FMN-containing dehydrogenase
MKSVQIKTSQNELIQLKGESIENLKRAFRGDLITAEDADYETARRVWNGSINKYPALIVRCEGTEDVITAVKFAKEHQLLLSIRAGGHNVSGASIIDQGFVIDVSQMRSVYVNPEKKTALVESGARLGDLDRETTVYGLAAPVGAVSETGVAGLTLHGGMGWQMRKHGLSIDNLKAIEIVTADGEWKRTSEEEYPDLFWALRGGGGNFGVVTAFEFNLHPIEPRVPFIMPMYRLEDSKKVLDFCSDYMAEAPDEMMMIAAYAIVPASTEIDEKDHGKPALWLLGCHTGAMDEAEKETIKLRKICEPIADMSASMQWTELQKVLDEDYPEGLFYYWKSIHFDSIDDEVLSILDRYTRNRPSDKSTIDIWFLGGAMNRVPSDATAFVNRHTAYIINIEANWDNESESQANIEWSRKLYKELEPLTGGGNYLNFPGYLEEKEEMLRGAYGQNLDRLIQVKKKYDPDNLFPGLLNITSKVRQPV